MSENRENLSQQIYIRSAVIEDIPQIEAELRKSWQMHADKEPELYNVKRLLDSDITRYYRDALKDDKSVVFVAETKGEFAGFIRANIIEIEPWYIHNEIFWMDDVCTVEKFRREGIATKLIERVEQEARNRGIKRIQGKIYDFNHPAQEAVKALDYNFPYTIINKVLR